MYNLDYLKKISDNDQDFIKDIIKTFIENSVELLEAIESLPAKDEYDQLSRMVHKFIPSLNFIGAKTFQPDLNQLEIDLLKTPNTKEVANKLQETTTNLNELVAVLRNDFNM
jgi:HPt (histidine-containing phosphotransfer) domain-containing protein